MDNKYLKLIDEARKARKFSYTPYSGFNVGAALLTTEGKIYTGCNIESVSFSPTNCAERTALFKAVSEGERSFEAIAVVGGKGEAEEGCTPCGVCRQMLSEFVKPDFLIIFKLENEFRIKTMRELLPFAFDKL